MMTRQAIVPGLVSTIIPVHNRPEMLRRAVESVLLQTHRPIEVIIADDGSTDSTPRVAESLVQSDPETIRYVRQQNAGPGPARESGRRIASGEFIQYLDSDDRLLPNKFADQVAALTARPDCDVAYGTTRLVDPSGKSLRDPFKWTAKRIPELFPGLLVDRWWCTHTPLYRRSLTDRIGPWCTMRWSQDWEYDSRVGAINTKLVHCGAYVSEHVHHDGVRQTSTADWNTDPQRLRNRVELLDVLWKAAEAAGVPSTAPERQHFARWCFAIGRNCAAAGLRESADACFELAMASSGTNGAGRKGVAPYRWMLRTLGPTLTSGVSRLAERLKGQPGPATMEQSFTAKGKPAENACESAFPIDGSEALRVGRSLPDDDPIPRVERQPGMRHMES